MVGMASAIPLPHGLDTVKTPLLEKLPTTAEPILERRVVHQFWQRQMAQLPLPMPSTLGVVDMDIISR